MRIWININNSIYLCVSGARLRVCGALGHYSGLFVGPQIFVNDGTLWKGDNFKDRSQKTDHPGLVENYGPQG